MHDIRKLIYRATGKRAARCVALILFPVFVSVHAPAFGQPSNLEAYQHLAVECLGGVPDTVSSFTLSAAENMPYLRPALTGYWQGQQRTVFLNAPGAAENARSHLKYDIVDARVEYRRMDRHQWLRRVFLELQFSLTDAQGRLLVDDRCARAFEDAVRSEVYESLELALYPETQGEPPPGRTIQRYVEPVVIGAAISIMAYLLFTVRSRSDSQ